MGSAYDITLRLANELFCGRLQTNMAKLTKKEALFCKEYVIHFNATQSAIKAGISEKSAGQLGHRMLKKVQIQREIGKLIAERAERLDIKGDQVLDEIRRFAFLDVADAFNEDGTVKNIHDIPEEVRRCISSIEVKELFEGSYSKKRKVGEIKKIRFHDKTKGLDMFGKHLGMWLERIEHSAPGGGPLQINMTVNLVKGGK